MPPTVAILPGTAVQFAVNNNNNNNIGRISICSRDSLGRIKFVDFSKKPDECFGTRHIIAFLCFLGTIIVYMLRVNMSVAIVAMVNRTAVEVHVPKFGQAAESSYCQPERSFNESSSIVYNGPEAEHEGMFHWDTRTRGLILSSFFWGYVPFQIPGGILSERFGGKWVAFMGVLVASLFTFLTPISADWGSSWLIANRLIVGAGEGVFMPALHSVLGMWSPVMERGKLAGFAVAGASLGAVFGLIFSGIIAAQYGWQNIFYIYGFAGIVWCLVWGLMSSDRPASQTLFISEYERNYIEHNCKPKGEKVTGTDDEEVKVPWLAILLSGPFWAVTIAHFGADWGQYTLLTQMPAYMNAVLKFDLQMNGSLSALPYLVTWLFSHPSNYISDMLQTKGIISTTTARKIWCTIGFALPAICLVGLAYSGCSKGPAIAMLIAAIGFTGANFSGYVVNDIDLSPKFAGAVMGISNCVANIASMMVPYIAGVTVTNHEDLTQWRTFFLMASGMYLATNLVFVLFGSGEVQEWNNPKETARRKSVAADGQTTTEKTPVFAA